MRRSAKTVLFPAFAFALTLSGSALAAGIEAGPLVDAQWLEQNISNPELVVIDVRDPIKEQDVYKAGHIAGAVAAPYEGFGWRTEVNGFPGMLPPADQIAAKIGSLGIDNSKHVVIVSDGADSTEFGKATRVYWTFKVLGHDAVSILDGGIRAWVAAEKPLATEGKVPVTATFNAELQPALLATKDDVKAAIDSSVQLLDGRPARQFTGDGKAPVATRAGTIPTALHIAHSAFYDGSFLSAKGTARLAQNVSLASDQPVIAFCNTGHWASIAWFGMSEIAGQKNVSLYDGSMAEWTKDESLPVN